MTCACYMHPMPPWKPLVLVYIFFQIQINPKSFFKKMLFTDLFQIYKREFLQISQQTSEILDDINHLKPGFDLNIQIPNKIRTEHYRLLTID